MWTFLVGSKLGRGIAAAGALVVAAGIIALRLIGIGAQRARQKAKEADHARAEDIRERKDEAMRRLDGDTRPVDDKLRDIGGLRD